MAGGRGMNAHSLWFATRGFGVVALLLLTAIVALGVAGATRWRSTRWPRFVVAGLHRNLSLLVLVFIALHVITTVADGYAPISLLSAVLPFTSPYRPLWLGLGAVALDLLLALTITSLLRARIGYGRWRALHWLAYASWPVALVHGLGTGTDARVGWMQVVTAACVGSVVAAILWRVGTSQATPGMRAASTVAALVVPLVIGGWYLGGPARHGWAARAGTPQTLLAHATTISSRRVVVTAPAIPLPTSSFTARFNGRVRESPQDANGRVLVNISGRTTGGDSGILWIRLQGEPIEGGGVAMTASGASYGPPAFPDAYVGKIVGLSGNRIQLSLNSQASRLSLVVDLRLDPAKGTATGLVLGTPSGA
jgi:Ferric reductase like transmembrane component